MKLWPMTMANPSREAYLKTWNPYPERTPGASVGRVVSSDDRTIVIRLFGVNGKVIKLSALSHKWVVVGDIVGLSKNQKNLQLLAPVQKEPRLIEFDLRNLHRWTQFHLKVREFFVRKKFVEVMTPTLVQCPGTEPFLDVFTTEFQMGQTKREYFLPTSPELHLKKSLAMGLDRVFEIRSCFRNGEISPTHQPEFQMLEWYRVGENLQAIKKDLSDLMTHLARVKKFKSVSMSELFKIHLDFSLTPQTSLQELRQLARRFEISSANHDWDDLFALIFLEKVEPQIDSQIPIFVEDYPPSQAAYARIGKSGWAERFELYWKGMEIGNAFHELNDPDLQKTRMQEDLARKKSIGKPAVGLDEDFFSALESGMPPSSGVAVGLERLFMAVEGIKNLNEVRLFPMK